MRTKCIAILVSIASLTGCASGSRRPASADGAGSTIQIISCELKKDQREIGLKAVKPKGCELWYSKAGTNDKVAWSSHFMRHCETTRDRMRAKLESAGFKCR